MKFDYTKGKTEAFVVFVRDRVVTDRYGFSDYDEAKQLFNKIVAERKDEVATVRLIAKRKGYSETLETFSNNDEVRRSWGTQLAYYDFVDDAVYIRSEAILPNPKRVDRKTYGDAFKKSYDERIEAYATDEEKALIKAFIEKHKGAKLSEFTTLG